MDLDCRRTTTCAGASSSGASCRCRRRLPSLFDGAQFQLDIGGDFAGSTASVMNMCGNVGAAISPALLAYLVKGYGWNVPFLMTAALCLIAAALYLKIDAGRRINV